MRRFGKVDVTNNLLQLRTKSGRNMKKFLASFAVGALLLTASLADEIKLPHVTVYGTARTEVTPDEMIWALRVENKGAVLEEVANEHAKHTEALLTFLKAGKVDEKTLQTSRMEFGQNWEYRSNTRIREGYFAATAVTFKIKDFGRYENLWLGLAKMPVVSVESVSYDHSKRIEFRNETRQKAVLAAREKAVTLAKTLGSDIAEPLSLEEDLQTSEGWSANLAANNVANVKPGSDEAELGSAGLSLGTIPITARVKASFRLVTSPK